MQFGRGAGGRRFQASSEIPFFKKNQRRQNISRCFQIRLFHLWQFDSLHLLAMYAEIQRQLGGCTLFELIQILIYLIHEIENHMTDQSEGGAASGSNVIVENSDEESSDGQL